MDNGSPVSLDFTFPFGNSPLDETTRGPGNVGTRASQAYTNPQQRARMASSDSVFEREIGGGWSPAQPRSNSNHSPPDERAENSQDDGEGEKTPAWSELKTKAGKERKRLPLACIACRRKKIKCSGEKPACKHCLKARIPCVYKVTTRKAAPRTDYMAMLDKRLKRMEDRVIKIIPKEDMPDLNATGRSSVRPPLPGTAPKKEKAQSMSKRSAEEAFDMELSEWTKPNNSTKALDKTAQRRLPREGDNKLFSEGTESLPPPQIQEHLAEVFFDCVYGQSYLLLHKPSFMRKLKAGTVPPVLILAVCAISSRFSTHPQVSTEPAFLRGEQWANAARHIVEKRHFEPNITILTVMLILGLHYFGTCEGGLSWSFGGQAMRMGYALQLHRELDRDPLGRAQAERAAASGKPAPSIPELSFTDREIRRRTMWACYLMDTFNSSGTERPSFLSEDYLSIQLPIKESNFQMEIPGHTEDLEGHVPLLAPQSSLTSANDEQAAEAKANMGVAAYVVRAVVLWKHIVQYLNLGGKEKDPHSIWDPLSEFANLQRQITALRSSLPPTLTYTPENLSVHVNERLANQFIFLHVVLAQASLFLHRFAIPTAPNTHRPYPPNTPKTFLATSATTVLEAAAQISQYLADSTGHTLTVPFAGYCAYASATVHVWGIFSRHTALEKSSRDNLRHNYKYLNRMKRYWGMFHYMAESIKDTYRMFAEAASRLSARMQKHSQQQSSLAAASAAIDPVESAEPSRAASPTADPASTSGDHTSSTAGDGDDKTSSSGRPKMLQYGDWFNKYPHGVSESEWESTRLPHRSETQRGTEAVMSQQSDLQSVEEFFASLSPPSKADEQATRGRKVAKKRGKSVAEEKGATTPGKSKDVVTEGPGQPHGQSSGTLGTARKPSGSSGVQSQYPQQHRTSQTFSAPVMQSLSETMSISQQPQIDLPSDIDIPMSNVASGLQSDQGTSAFDLASPAGLFSQGGQFGSLSGNTALPSMRQTSKQQTHSPFDYTSPSTISNPGGGTTSSQQQGLNFNFSYTSALPHLDRQMVFGGYAGIDPSTSGSANALNNPNDFDFWTNPWDVGVDMDGFSGFNDSFVIGDTSNPDPATASSGPGQNGIGQASQNQSQYQQGLSSSAAWFMPFNIEPPSYGVDDFSGLDAMDVSGNAFPSGSFSSPSGGDGQDRNRHGSGQTSMNLY